MTESSSSIESIAPQKNVLWIGFLLVALLLGGLVYQQIELTKQLLVLTENQARTAKKTEAMLGTLDQTLKDVSSKSEQQSVLIHRALGNALPMVVPEETARVFDEVEKQLSNPETWPAEIAAVDVLTDKVRKAIDESPPWVQEALLPRVVPIRWTLEGLWLLGQGRPTDIVVLDDVAQRIATHRLNRPQKTPDEMASRLKEASAELEVLAPGLAKEAAKLKAQQAIDGTADLAEALVGLEGFDGAEIEALRPHLQSAFQREQLRARLDVMEGEASRFKEINPQDLKERVATSFFHAVQDLRLAALATKMADKEIANRIDALMKTAADNMNLVRAEASRRAAVQLREYQIWALKNINAVPSLKQLQDQQIKQIKSVIDRNNPLGGERKSAEQRGQDQLAEQLILQLGVIDARLLDDAVGEWYRRVFSDRFGSLDGPHQAKVVEGFAVASKKEIEGRL